ncbi:hypothetical protein L6452_14820 [Arctium lappa]|uniref:Uncharacterized protein n=1 Tax=Arctium lappa TaxID=4217 RepID=A0ACB9CM20_ARCLA|nr:hypothetical protein L6452_14820 [Arctium lappa]
MSERVRNLKEIFPGAIGALDGTLIHAVVPLNQQARYRGRGRGDCFQNVLAMCDFNMIFTYVWAGWEGIAHDARVLREVAFDPNSRFSFPPPNKYYLCDAAYPNTRSFLTPYRNTRKKEKKPKTVLLFSGHPFSLFSTTIIASSPL